MNDSTQRSPEPSQHGPDGSDYEVALDVVGLVIAWYSERILAERRSGTQDAERLEQLIAQYQSCVEDRERLEDASGEETARIRAAYEALLDRLESTKS